MYYQMPRSISSKLFVIASGEANVYESSYYWNCRIFALQTSCLSHIISNIFNRNQHIRYLVDDDLKGVKRVEHFPSSIKYLIRLKFQRYVFKHSNWEKRSKFCLFDSFFLNGELSVSSMWDLVEHQCQIYIII